MNHKIKKLDFLLLMLLGIIVSGQGLFAADSPLLGHVDQYLVDKALDRSGAFTPDTNVPASDGSGVATLNAGFAANQRVLDQYQRDQEAIARQNEQIRQNAIRLEQKRQEDLRLAPSRAINSCNNGNINMCFLVGNGYRDGAYTINNIYTYFGYDDFKAVQFYTKACNSGNMKGCSALGSMYSTGKGIPQNKDKAAELFTRACNANESSACNNLGVMYQNSYGFWQGNKFKVSGLYRKSCELGCQNGCSNYAKLGK